MEFISYNNNPKKRKCDDCVIRAISFAINKSWIDTYKSIVEFGINKGLVFNDTRNIKAYITSYLKYPMQDMPRRVDRTRYTVREFADELAKPNAIYIVSVAKHLTVIKNKNLYDTWNCSKKSVRQLLANNLVGDV